MHVQLEKWKIYSSNYEDDKGKIKQEMDNLTDLMKTKVSMLQPEIPLSHLLRRQSSDLSVDPITFPMSRESSMESRQNSVPDFSTKGSTSIEMNPVNSPLFIEGEPHLKDSKKKMTKVYNFLNGRSKHYAPVLTLLRSSIDSLVYLLKKMKDDHTFDSVVYMSSLSDLTQAMDKVNERIEVGHTFQKKVSPPNGNTSYKEMTSEELWSILKKALYDMRQANVLLPLPPPAPHQPSKHKFRPISQNSRPPSIPIRTPSPVTNSNHSNHSNQEGPDTYSKNNMNNVPS